MKIDHDGLAFARQWLDNTLSHNYDFQRNSSASSGVTNDWLGGHAIRLLFLDDWECAQYLANHTRLRRNCMDGLATDALIQIVTRLGAITAGYHHDLWRMEH